MGSWWSVGEGSSDGVSAVCVELEVEVFHGWGGVICGGRAVESVLVDDGDAASVFVDSVLLHYLVAVRGSSGDVLRGLVFGLECTLICVAVEVVRRFLYCVSQGRGCAGSLLRCGVVTLKMAPTVDASVMC